MKRSLALVAAAGALMTVTALALQQPVGHPVLEAVAKVTSDAPPSAIVLEMGVNDDKPRDWSGHAVVKGAKVVRREGYRFRAEDKLVDPAGWQMSSHRGLRAPKGMPGIGKIEPIASIGVVFHLSDVQPDGMLVLNLEKGAKEAQVALADVLTGKTVSLWNGAAEVRLLTTAQALGSNAKVSDDCPAAAYGADGTLWLSYIRYHDTEAERRIEPPKLAAQPADFKAFDTPGFGEQVMVQTMRAGHWSEAVALPSAGMEDIAGCAITADKAGNAWIAYSAQRDGNFDIFIRSIHQPPQGKNGSLKFGVERRLTNGRGPDLHPVMATAADGMPWLACQSWDDKGKAAIQIFQCVDGEWHARTRLAHPGENCWHPAIAAGPEGRLAVAYDTYHNGNYDVQVALYNAGDKKFTSVPVASTPRFEARPSLVYDKSGRLWIAYEEGPEKWGKDYGALAPGRGNPLYNERSVRVVCLDKDGTLQRPTADLPRSKYAPPVLPFEAIKTNQYERAIRYSNPQLGLDGRGRVWLSYRRNFGSRYTTHPGSYWLSFARRLDGNAWSAPLEIHHSDGLLNENPVLLPHPSGQLLLIHNTDGRYTTPERIDNQIFASVVSLPVKDKDHELVAHSPGSNPPTKHVTDEFAAVSRMHDYRVDAGSQKLRFLRGEFHRHTEISWDGSPDGSLEDMFRYAIDAARMEWIGNGDHDSGAGREYSWHLIQKWTDAYHTAHAFTPMFTYERSVPYPHGHRNCMFDRRGIRTLPRLAPPDNEKAPGGVHGDDTKMLYRYLKELGGICASHTSATGMGTDWRDNDPVAESIVEIYQGDRMSYEMEGAPRAGFDPQTGQEPANVAGWFPKGFIDHPLKRGVKLSFQASSDHWSTHISFCIVLAESHDRKGILAALKKRHCYAATDNIVVDFRSGTAVMGDEVQTRAAPSFQLQVHGTNNLAKIEVLRDSVVVDTLRPKAATFTGPWTDPQPRPGMHYYYVRILQADGEIAWGSPIWVDYKS